jgi:hypothetical protein
MTNKEAKECLEEIKNMDDSMYQYNSVYLEAIEMAIKALEAQGEPTDEEIKEYCRSYANHHKNKMINRDCYGCQKGGIL